MLSATASATDILWISFMLFSSWGEYNLYYNRKTAVVKGIHPGKGN